MVRLSRRTYAEAGVAMYLVPEDLTTDAPPAPASGQDAKLAQLFEDVSAALEARNGPLSARDIAHILEVLADRHFLDTPMSQLSQ